MRMNYRLSIILILSLFLGLSQATAQVSRKKVGVVLSGGGAKGTAHVRALKVIEEAGIPIDVIVGTSMGSIVGGLYATGYTTDQLDSIVKVQDWMSLLTDAVSRKAKKLTDKMEDERCVLSFNFDQSPSEVLEGGVLKGNRIGQLFTNLTAGYNDSIDFRKLPVPFACAAVDIVTGQEIDMFSGVLPVCMRSSMAIPGVFAPIKSGDMVLVDGGLANNYPVDLAKKLGADYIIGVRVGADKKEASKIKGVGDVLAQILDIVCENKVMENEAMTDVLIKVDVTGYSSASFSNTAIDSLMARGEAAARSKWDELVALKNKLNLSAPVEPRVARKVPNDTIVKPDPRIYNPTIGHNSLFFGARYDSEEMASLLLGGTYELKKNSKMLGGLEVRLGKRSYGEVSLALNHSKHWNLDASYRLSTNEIKVYSEGKHAGLMDFTEHYGLLEFSRSWKEVYVSFGVEYTFRNYHNYLANGSWIDLGKNLDHEHGLGYFAYMHFDNQDSKVYPRNGFKWTLQYVYNTDNGYNYRGRGGMHILEGVWQVAIPASSSLTLIPQISGRMLPSKNDDGYMMNVIGGINSYGHYERHQMPFAGANYMEIVSNNLLIGGLTARQRLGTNQYLFGVANYAMLGKKVGDFFTTRNLFGAAVGYGFRSPIGPIEANLNWSTLTHKPTFYVNVGYEF